MFSKAKQRETKKTRFTSCVYSVTLTNASDRTLVIGVTGYQNPIPTLPKEFEITARFGNQNLFFKRINLGNTQLDTKSSKCPEVGVTS